MTENTKQFIERVTRLEKRYKGDKYAVTFQMPREMMVALKDELKENETARLCLESGQTKRGVKWDNEYSW